MFSTCTCFCSIQMCNLYIKCTGSVSEILMSLFTFTVIAAIWLSRLTTGRVSIGAGADDLALPEPGRGRKGECVIW